MSPISSSFVDSLQPPWIHVPPQTNWAVQDNKLKSRPPFYPPVNPYTTVYIGDASPSTVAVRIAECLRKNNVIVEYDDEAATAHAYTCDQVLMDISLFRGIKGTSTSVSRGGTVDLSHGVMVECIRIQGDTIPFHRTCHGIFASARGDSDGLDQERRKHGCFQDSPLGRCPMTQLVQVSTTMTGDGNVRNTSPRFYHFQPNFVESKQETTSTLSSSSKAIFTAAGALHKALSLLEKDRYDAQMLGLQLLVMLTDTFSSRLPVAIHCSICVLGGPLLQDGKSKIQVDHSSLQRIHDWIVALLIKREEFAGTSSFSTTSITPSFSTKFMKSSMKKSLEDTTAAAAASTAPTEWSMEHYVSLRILALRVLVNALSVWVTQKDMISNHQYYSSQKQYTTLRLDPFWTDEFLVSFIQDIRGAGRPPFTYLGSSNEAALSIRFLRLLALHSKVAKLHLIQALRTLGMQEVLDRAFVIGMSTHRSLEEECTLLLQLLTA